MYTFQLSTKDISDLGRISVIAALMHERLGNGTESTIVDSDFFSAMDWLLNQSSTYLSEEAELNSLAFGKSNIDGLSKLAFQLRRLANECDVLITTGAVGKGSD